MMVWLEAFRLAQDLKKYQFDTKFLYFNSSLRFNMVVRLS